MSHNLTLRGKAVDIPETIEIDTSHLKVGEAILLNELTLPQGVTAVVKPQVRVVAVAASRITAKANESDDKDSSAEEKKAEEKKED